MSLSKNELCYDIMEMIVKQYTIIKEKTNSSGEKWSNFLQTLPYIENNQSLQFPPSILNRPPLPK